MNIPAQSPACYEPVASHTLSLWHPTPCNCCFSSLLCLTPHLYTASQICQLTSLLSLTVLWFAFCLSKIQMFSLRMELSTWFGSCFSFLLFLHCNFTTLQPLPITIRLIFTLVLAVSHFCQGPLHWVFFLLLMSLPWFFTQLVSFHHLMMSFTSTSRIFHTSYRLLDYLADLTFNLFFIFPNCSLK